MKTPVAAAFRAGMGDVDVEARVLLYDTWKGDQAAPRGRDVRQGGVGHPPCLEPSPHVSREG